MVEGRFDFQVRTTVELELPLPETSLLSRLRWAIMWQPKNKRGPAVALRF